MSIQEAKQDPLNATTDYLSLTEAEKTTLALWIEEHVETARTKHPRQNSYSLKHIFERGPGGFYVTNGQFKGAMKTAGHGAVDEAELNWRYRIRGRRSF